MNEQVTGSAALQGKEIERLAREYAEFVLDKAGHNNPLAYEVREDIVEDAISTFQWLLRDHCIVKKEKVRELYNEIHGTIMCDHDDDDWQDASHYILDVMPRSFVAIFGADLFKGKAKKEMM